MRAFCVAVCLLAVSTSVVYWDEFERSVIKEWALNTTTSRINPYTEQDYLHNEPVAEHVSLHRPISLIQSARMFWPVPGASRLRGFALVESLHAPMPSSRAKLRQRKGVFKRHNFGEALDGKMVVVSAN